jgi:hypothetical protein
MQEFYKVCDLPDDAGSLVVVNESGIGTQNFVLRHTFDSFPLLHGGNDPANPLVGPHCGGEVEVIQVPEGKEGKKVLVCSKCHFRQEIPNYAIFLCDLTNM